jgi:hypothetical protein
MSVTIANSCDVSNLQINNSPSKMTYSFSKTERFPQIKLNCLKHYYSSKEGISLEKGTSIGYGKRISFEKSGTLLIR